MRALIAALIVAAGLGAGCSTLEPDYHEEAIDFDPALLGTWEMEVPGEANGPRVVVRDQLVQVADGRLNPAQVRTTGEPASSEHSTARKYSIQVGPTERGGRVYSAYLVRVGAGRFIGLQLVDADAYGPPFIRPWLLPVHWIGRLRTAENTVTIEWPKNPVGWIPEVRWLDAPVENAAPPARSQDGFAVSPSIDRVLAYFQAHQGEAGFWADAPEVWRKVPGDAGAR